MDLSISVKAHYISLHMSDYTDEITIHGTATAIRKALLELEAAKKSIFHQLTH